MAFGIPPKYTLQLPLDGFCAEQFLVLAIEAAKKLDWNIGAKSESGFIAYTRFSMSSWSEQVSVTIEAGNAELKSECAGNQVIDWGKNKRNIEDLTAALDELKASFNPAEMEQHIDGFKLELASQTVNQQPARGKIKSVFSIFIPAQGYFVTPIIINLNIAVFILMVISGVDFMSPDNQSLLNWGANFRPLTMQGQWWRLLTNCFLHIGILHLLLNMYALIYIGLLLEPYLGKFRFIAAYLLTGLAASTASLWFHDQTISAGASGAIFGMYGVFLSLLTTNIIEKSARKTLLTSITVFVAYNLINGMKGGIDNAAHIGGLVCGFIIGYVYYPGLILPERMDLKVGSVAGISIAVCIVCFVLCSRIPNNIAAYDEKMKTFASMESMALEVYRMPKTTPKDSLLMEIKDRGLYYWNEDITLLRDIDKLDLPDMLHQRDAALIRYCKLRIKSYDLFYKAIDENSHNYKDSIDFYNKRVQAMIDSLQGK